MVGVSKHKLLGNVAGCYTKKEIPLREGRWGGERSRRGLNITAYRERGVHVVASRLQTIGIEIEIMIKVDVVGLKLESPPAAGCYYVYRATSPKVTEVGTIYPSINNSLLVKSDLITLHYSDVPVGRTME